MFGRKKIKNNPYPAITLGFRERALKKELLDLMPWDLIKDFQAFIFEKSSKNIKIGAVNPENNALKKFIKERFGSKIAWYSASKDDIAFVLKNYKHDFKGEILQLVSTTRESNDNVTKIIDRIIKYAITEKSSDIHIEPTRNDIKIRFRVDGSLHTVATLPRELYQATMARIKILANLKIDEYRRPQDGRIEPEEFPNTSLRVSTMPTLFGEKVALRVLDDSHKNLSINELGLSDEQEEVLLSNIEKPFGMIVTSGPTGSGKTTTLYALLQLLKKEGINVSTLEDPIEYILEGVNQIQINPRTNLTFPVGLRALLRQDPDIIMVGEIRDSETAGMAVDAALTGHLVFTTLHTNDAASAFTRFLEMDVEDFAVSSTVNLVVAQRLLRKVCPSCATKKKLSSAVLKKIRERKDIIAAIEAREEGLSEKIEKMTFRAGKGCDACFQTGYLGRVGIFELLAPNKEIHDLILKHGSSEEIKSAAERNGFQDMISDGLEKVFNGTTTFEELLRTTKNA